MAFMDIVFNYVVPVVAGFFFLLFASIFIYIIHRALLKPLGVYGMIKNMMLGLRRKKILADEKTLEYCVARIDKGWKEGDVRSELLLSNKYPKKKIDELVWAFNTIKKEMQGIEKKVAQDLP